jgi:hypothetical protein
MPVIFSQWMKGHRDPERYGWSSQLRWPLMSIAVGIISGLGAILFEELLRWSLHVLLQLPTGFIEPLRGSDLSTVTALAANRSWLFLVIPALGGLVSGIMVYYIAPEAEGHGTDAMIEAFHRRGGYIRKRVPLVKFAGSGHRGWEFFSQKSTRWQKSKMCRSTPARSIPGGISASRKESTEPAWPGRKGTWRRH